MATRDPIPEHMIPKVPESFIPKGYRANLDELARQISDGKPKTINEPLLGVAEALANLRFHELMEMVNVIVGDSFKVETPYDLAAALNVWALAQLSKN